MPFQIVPSNSRGHRWVGWVAGLVPIVCLFGLIAVWPGTSLPAWVSDEARLFLIAALAGALGGALQMARSYAGHLGGGRWDSRWLPWYGLRIPAGIGIAVVFYVALRAGLYADSASEAAVNPFGLATLCALAGLFSREALEKLNDLFDTLTGRNDEAMRRQQLLPTAVDDAAQAQSPDPAPVVESVREPGG